MESGRCPIWGTPARIGPREVHRSRVSSPRAGGDFIISDSAAALLKAPDPERSLRLTSWIYDQNRAGVDWPYVDTELLDRLRRARPKPIGRRLIDLLRRFRENYPYVGQEGPPIADILLAAAGCYNWTELRALWIHARGRGYAEFAETLRATHDAPSAERGRVWLTFEGHAWLESLDAQNPDSDQGFVAMWFDASMNAIYAEGFAPAIEAAGYSPMRVDQHDYAGKIDDEVIAQIRRSRFVVADLTAGMHEGEVIPRGSVYYEAGFAEGLGLPVIYTRREGLEEAVHFDLRQHNFIVWSTPEDLRDRLANRISAVLGDGPHTER